MRKDLLGYRAGNSRQSSRNRHVEDQGHHWKRDILDELCSGRKQCKDTSMQDTLLSQIRTFKRRMIDETYNPHINR